MEPGPETPEDIRLDQLLERARAPRLSRGLAQRVEETLLNELEATRNVVIEGIGHGQKGGLWGNRWARLAAALTVGALGMLSLHRAAPSASPEEVWMSAFTSGEIQSADLGLIAHLHEFIEDELSESNVDWLE